MADRPVLAVSTGPLWRTPLDEAFAAIRAAGGEGVEIMVTQNAESQSPNVLEKLGNCFDPTRNFQFGDDIPDVEFCRRLTDSKCIGNLLIVVTLDHQG